MSDTKTLPQGYAGPAQGLELDVVPDTVSNPDLTQVTAIVAVVTRPDLTTVTWHPTISPGATPTSLTATYLPASDGSDFAQLQLYRLAITAITNAGPWTCKRINYFIVPADQYDGP